MENNPGRAATCYAPHLSGMDILPLPITVCFPKRYFTKPQTISHNIFFFPEIPYFIKVMQIQKIISLIFNVKLVFFFLSNDSHTTLLFPHPNAFRLKMQFIRQDDNLFVFYVSFKKQFKLEINQTRDKNTLLSNMAPWHLGHHQRQRATCIFFHQSSAKETGHKTQRKIS